MKKKVTMILLAALLLTACSLPFGEKPAEDGGFTRPNIADFDVGTLRVVSAATENGCYEIRQTVGGTPQILYTDMTTASQKIPCEKEGCDHTGQGCFAWLPQGHLSQIFTAGGKLIVLTSDFAQMRQNEASIYFLQKKGEGPLEVLSGQADMGFVESPIYTDDVHLFFTCQIERGDNVMYRVLASLRLEDGMVQYLCDFTNMGILGVWENRLLVTKNGALIKDGQVVGEPDILSAYHPGTNVWEELPIGAASLPLGSYYYTNGRLLGFTHTPLPGYDGEGSYTISMVEYSLATGQESALLDGLVTNEIRIEFTWGDWVVMVYNSVAEEDIDEFGNGREVFLAINLETGERNTEMPLMSSMYGKGYNSPLPILAENDNHYLVPSGFVMEQYSYGYGGYLRVDYTDRTLYALIEKANYWAGVEDYYQIDMVLN